jgi:hypothetical protein
MEARISRASCSAPTRFGETGGSSEPPPTLNTRSASRWDSLEIVSHSLNTVSQPSSLTRAVSSETLSVGV